MMDAKEKAKWEATALRMANEAWAACGMPAAEKPEEAKKQPKREKKVKR